ncbi:hypothetical protein [Candidatus Spongiihabitans sp.]|uniref:hypothetical protein n=1 Tax=Candidatus Spongiihabitans sp. TaxID=3101308 RepID=UPI003C701EDF
MKCTGCGKKLAFFDIEQRDGMCLKCHTSKQEILESEKKELESKLASIVLTTDRCGF